MTATVASIQRHPLKSHGRESLGAISLAAGRSMPWDRNWAVAHEAAKLHPGEWAPCTNFSRGSKAPNLMAIEATFDEARGLLTLRHPERPDISFCPDNAEDAAAFIDWVRPLCPSDRAAPAQVVALPGRGNTDTDYPSVSLINLASNRALGEVMGVELSPKRWRGNFWIEGLAPFAEKDLIGKNLTLGTARLEIVQPIVRCLATTANPDTGQRDADTLGTLRAQFDHQNFGVYARVISGGTVAVGDMLIVSE